MHTVLPHFCSAWAAQLFMGAPDRVKRLLCLPCRSQVSRTKCTEVLYQDSRSVKNLSSGVLLYRCFLGLCWSFGLVHFPQKAGLYPDSACWQSTA